MTSRASVVRAFEAASFHVREPSGAARDRAAKRKAGRARRPSVVDFGLDAMESEAMALGASEEDVG